MAHEQVLPALDVLADVLPGRGLQRGTVLVVAGLDERSGIVPDLVVGTTEAQWQGINDGQGRLLARQVEIEVAGRRAGRPLRRTLWLPGFDGSVSAVSPVAHAATSRR